MRLLSKRAAVEEKAHILVVEDEAPIRRLIQAALDPKAYLIIETPSGEEALQLLAQQRFDLLVLDLRLDDLSGWDVLDAIRTRRLREAMRVMILTAQSAERDILRGWQQGVDQYCMKPFEPRQFVEVVEMVLGSTDNELARYRQSEIERTQLLRLVDNVFDER